MRNSTLIDPHSKKIPNDALSSVVLGYLHLRLLFLSLSLGLHHNHLDLSKSSTLVKSDISVGRQISPPRLSHSPSSPS